MEAETILTIFRGRRPGVIVFFGAWAARRVLFLVKLTRAARPNPERSLRNAAKANLRMALVNIFGNRKLLRWIAAGHRPLLGDVVVLRARRPRCSRRRVSCTSARPSTCRC